MVVWNGSNKYEKKILFIEIKSIMSSEVKVLADTDSEDEIIEKKSRIHYTPQSAIDLDRVPNAKATINSTQLHPA